MTDCLVEILILVAIVGGALYGLGMAKLIHAELAMRREGSCPRHEAVRLLKKSWAALTRALGRGK